MKIQTNYYFAGNRFAADNCSAGSHFAAGSCSAAGSRFAVDNYSAADCRLTPELDSAKLQHQ